jgi:Protein of unknown function (DUF3095)
VARFYTELPAFDAFERIVDPAVFKPVPDDAVIGISDIVSSTAAIAAGRYKTVNMAGAAMISAVMNALGHRNFPFVFGGDGASFVASGADIGQAREAVARTARWVREDLDLDMRVAQVPVSAIRAAGHDVRVARYAASSSASYAMFSGGGLAWAERQMKTGAFALAPAAPGERPDLTGLSCRWEPLQSKAGVMLSLLVQRPSDADPKVFADVVLKLLAAINTAEGREGHPLPAGGPRYRWPPAGLDLEARATRGLQSLASRKLALRMQTLLALVLFRTGWKMGKFEPGHYVRQSGLNTDFRKFDDGLRMTIDCRPETMRRLQQLLDTAEAQGVVHYGMHEQTEALMTCIVPSIMTDDHLHFVDGAGGGYAMAAVQLKTKLAARTAA